MRKVRIYMGIDYHRETSCFFEVQMLQGRGEASLLCLETPEQHGPVLPHGERGGENVSKSEEEKIVHSRLQVERGGELFRASCDICCESVPLLRQPGRSLTCEVRISFNRQLVAI